MSEETRRQIASPVEHDLTKRCSRCGKGKLLDAFSKKLLGLNSICKKCDNAKAKQYYAQPKAKEKRRKYRTRSEVRERTRENAAKPERKERKRKYDSQPEVKKRRREYFTEYSARRYKNDLCYRLRKLLSARIRDVLKGNTKAAKTIELIGCSAESLKLHLEKQFKKHMTWDNYGLGWHVDHIIPCDAFDLTDPDEQKRCFHYTNLQPLWAKQNIRKGTKWSGQWTMNYDLQRQLERR